MMNGKFKHTHCVFCNRLELGLNQIDLTVISKSVCLNCAENVTIGKFHKEFKWLPSLVYKKTMSQLLKTYDLDYYTKAKLKEISKPTETNKISGYSNILLHIGKI